MINFVYHKCQGYKLSTLLHWKLHVVFGGKYFFIVCCYINGGQMRFLQVAIFPYSKNRFSVNLSSSFFNLLFCPGRGCFFPVNTNKLEYDGGKMSSLAGLNKSFSISRKSTAFGLFWLPRSTFKVDFLNVEAKFRNSLVKFLEDVVGSIVWGFKFSIFSGCRG